jgi:predicted ATPase
MQLRAVQCSGYKAFRTLTDLPLRQLTVLFGKNNSGKTTLARLPLFVVASVSNEASMYTLSAAGQRFGSSFADLGSVDQAHPSVSFGVHWTSNRRIAIELQNVISRDSESVQLVYLAIDNDIKKHFRLQPRSESSAFAFVTSNLAPDETDRFYERIQDARNTLSQIVHIPSSRPRLETTYSTRAPDGWTVDDTPYILNSDRSVLNEVDKWFRANLDGVGIAVDQAAFAFQLTQTKDRASVNLAESGRGVQSCLPVVTLLRAISNMREESFVIVEEPEAHLHPSVHGAMADLIIDCARRSQVVVETHSENFVLRMRRRIAEQRLKPNNVGLYYLDESHRVIEIKIDASGGAPDWPAGVFETDIDEARAIVEAKLAAMGGLSEDQ